MERVVTIVVVDDDADVRHIATTLLRNAGYRVLAAADGRTGLEIIRAEHPQVVLLDLMMPGLHGFAVCQEIQSDPSLKDVQIIVASSKAYPVDIKKAKALGAREYVVKPFDLNHLLALVRNVAPSSSPSFKVKFWGTRGSIPTPGPATQRYGGNTACVEVRCADQILMFDCGTGAREMGLSLQKEFAGRPMRLNIFISHTHWDHIQGFPFFLPAYSPANRIALYSLRGADKSLEKIFTGQMDASYFPVELSDMRAQLEFVELEGTVALGPVEVTHTYLNHPGVAIGFRVEHQGKSIVYLSDHEPHWRLQGDNQFNRTLEQKVTAFAHGADLYIREAQYTEEEYPEKKGWGHSTWADALDAAREANVKRLVLTHHDPMHDDETMDRILAACQARMEANKMNFQLMLAADYLELTI